MKLVIAGSYDEFHRDFRCSHKDYKYLATLPQDLRGHECTTLILSGTYYKRKDFARHEEDIYTYCRAHNILIKRTKI